MKKGLLGVCFSLVFLILFMNNVLGFEATRSNIKTVEFFIHQNDTGLKPIRQNLEVPFYFFIPENETMLRGGWIEIQGIAGGQIDTTIHVAVNDSADVSRRSGFLGTKTGIYSLDSAGETQRFVIRHPFTRPLRNGLNGPFILNVSVMGTGAGAGGATISLLNAKLILTYEYDLASPRQLKTVRYFVGQNDTATNRNHTVNMTFPIFIPESGPIRIHSSFLEIRGVSTGDLSATTGLNVSLNLSMVDNGFAIGHKPKPFFADINTTTATQAFLALYNASPVYNITFNSTTLYTVNLNATVNVSLWGAEAVVTYEYDNSSTNQLNTVRMFLNGTNVSVASNVNSIHQFNIPIAEDAVNVTSAYIKISGFFTAVDANNIRISIGPNNPAAPANRKNYTYKITTEGSDWMVLYNASSLYNLSGGRSNGPYYLNVTSTGPATTALMAELVLTYNYTSNSVNRMKTVEYGPFQDALQRTAAVQFYHPFSLYAQETNISVKSAYLQSESVTSATAAHTLRVGFDFNDIVYTQGNTGETTFDYLLTNASSNVYNFSQGLEGPFWIGKSDSAIASLTSGKVISTFFFR